MVDGRPLVFAPSEARPLGQAVAAELGVALSELEERKFDDGEHKLRPVPPVQGRQVFVLQRLAADGTGESVNDRLLRLLFLLGALADAGAASVTVVAPYLSYSRKDRRGKPQDPVSTRYLAQLFEAVGGSRLVTLEVHNPAAFDNAFRRPTVHLDAHDLICDALPGLLAGEVPVVVSPDSGGIKRAESFRLRLAERLRTPVELAFVEKHRHEGRLAGGAFIGEPGGRPVLILDDLLSSGGTLLRAVDACRAHGATRILAAVTHGLFVRGAAAALSGSALERLLITDSTGVPIPKMLREKAQVLPLAPLLADEIRRLSVT